MLANSLFAELKKISRYRRDSQSWIVNLGGERLGETAKLLLGGSNKVWARELKLIKVKGLTPAVRPREP